MERRNALLETGRIVANGGEAWRFGFRELALSIVEPNAHRLSGEWLPQDEVLVAVRVDVSCAENQPGLRKPTESRWNGVLAECEEVNPRRSDAVSSPADLHARKIDSLITVEIGGDPQVMGGVRSW
jgi:hypothetical protein